MLPRVIGLKLVFVLNFLGVLEMHGALDNFMQVCARFAKISLSARYCGVCPR